MENVEQSFAMQQAQGKSSEITPVIYLSLCTLLHFFQMYVNLKEYNSKLYANLEDLHGGD